MVVYICACRGGVIAIRDQFNKAGVEYNVNAKNRLFRLIRSMRHMLK